jgi:hypothetical protein
MKVAVVAVKNLASFGQLIVNNQSTELIINFLKKELILIFVQGVILFLTGASLIRHLL